MIKLTDIRKNSVSKVIIIIIALLNLSFISYDWEKDIKSRDKVHKNISTIFNSSTYTINSTSDNFYTISESERIIGYLIVQSEFSKYKKFDYFIIYNNSAEILKVKILNYREVMVLKYVIKDGSNNLSEIIQIPNLNLIQK